MMLCKCWKEFILNPRKKQMWSVICLCLSDGEEI